VDEWRRRVSDTASIVNLYGPTEATLANCFCVVPEQIEADIVPVGRPLPATQALIVTATHALAGIGEIGDIVIRSAYVTYGYVDRAADEPDGFAISPFTRASDDRVYWSGDYGRYLADGTIEVIGRRDDQVKIRGVRVDPKEIERVLLEHPAVAAAAVYCTIAASDQQPVIRASVVSARRDVVVDLRRYLRERVSPQMVPTTIEMRGELPLTENGKIDYVSLRRAAT
jgi:acyl-coenzyme A synthetase/AMP-(fatty) acid ligase